MIKYFIFFACISLCLACQTEPSTDTSKSTLHYVAIQGKTMGTTYTIKYLDKLQRNFKTEVDELLIEVNNEVSTYEPASFISRFNKVEKELQYFKIKNQEEDLKHFKANFEKAKEVFDASQGYFDPTIMPIVNYWGFGYTEKRAVKDIDKAKVDSLMKFVGFKKITQNNAADGWTYLTKENAGVQLDFSAIAKGYGVDAVAMLLESHNVENYYVEIGGELVVKGKNPRNQWWTIGINVPNSAAEITDVVSRVELRNQAVATSGNYRNFYEVDGVKYAHTINPETGYPEKNRLLSATIFAKDCMTADAYATACMTMGLDKSREMITQIADVDAYFLYSDTEGKVLSVSTNPALEVN